MLALLALWISERDVYGNRFGRSTYARELARTQWKIRMAPAAWLNCANPNPSPTPWHGGRKREGKREGRGGARGE